MANGHNNDRSAAEGRRGSRASGAACDGRGGAGALMPLAEGVDGWLLLRCRLPRLRGFATFRYFGAPRAPTAATASKSAIFQITDYYFGVTLKTSMPANC